MPNIAVLTALHLLQTDFFAQRIKIDDGHFDQLLRFFSQVGPLAGEVQPLVSDFAPFKGVAGQTDVVPLAQKQDVDGVEGFIPIAPARKNMLKSLPLGGVFHVLDADKS